MEYDSTTVESIVQRFGEVFFVLDSGEEYIVHGTEGYETKNIGGHAFLRAEGQQGDEYLKVEFPLDAIEHHYTHKEV